jgi:hypothetical protein
VLESQNKWKIMAQKCLQDWPVDDAKINALIKK